MRLEPSGIPPLDRWSGWARRSDAGALLVRLAATLRQVQPAELESARAVVSSLVERARDSEVGVLVRSALAALVDAARGRRFLAALEKDQVQGWLSVLLPALEAADYSVGTLLRARAREAPGQVVLQTSAPEEEALDASAILRRSRELAAGFHALLHGEREGRVALLAENSPDLALCDLACLAHGLVDVPVPANAAADQVQYVLRHAQASVLVASDEAQLAKVLPARGSLPNLVSVVVLEPGVARRHGLLCLEDVIERGACLPFAALEERAAAVRSGDLATVMYTSGTTGTPKGIAFSQRNLVAKRLCRSFALPDIGQGDVMLSYLPLFHTFGRYLELLGALWTGATYVFARSPALSALLEDFAAVGPSLFISVPQKWKELHERAMQEAGGEDDPERTAQALRRLTGGKLRFGLSAAGFLDPHVFRAFQRAGVELCSGYGMTEATGGVTMTPPGQYLEGSIGKPLPGIETRLAADGELQLRGPYLMQGYFRPTDGDTGLDADGWFSTGDLVAQEERGHLRLTGRKKEIYKNTKGQTIAPQRVENLFRDFDAISQAFLVGDGREFNTLLIWPRPGHALTPVALTAEEGAGGAEHRQRALLGSLVSSANRFLAPYERVVDFAVLDRPLCEEHGELTPKGSFKRDVVERNHAALIEPMYRRADARVEIGAHELVIPNWLLREIGVLREDLVVEDGRLRARGRSLDVGPAEGGIRIGDFVYSGRRAIDLGTLLGTPALALGNEGLSAFVGPSAFLGLLGRRSGEVRGLVLSSTREAPAPGRWRRQSLLPLVESTSLTRESLHAAAVLLRGSRRVAKPALEHLDRGVGLGAEAAAVCRSILRRAADLPDERVRRLAFLALLPIEEPSETISTLQRFLGEPGGIAVGHRPSRNQQPPVTPSEGATLRQVQEREPGVEGPLDWGRPLASSGRPTLGVNGAESTSRLTAGEGIRERDLARLGSRGGLSAAQVEALLGQLRAHAQAREVEERAEGRVRRTLVAAMRLLSAYAVAHPAWYPRLHIKLARLSLHADAAISARAAEELDRLQLGFRSWLGPNLRLAVDPETGREYGWRDVLVCDPQVPGQHQSLLSRAVAETPLLREAAFLFGRGALLSLVDLPPGSVRVEAAGSRADEALYRLSAQPRAGEPLEVALHLAEAVPVLELREEIHWLLTAGAPPPLVQAFGGYYPEHGLYTTEHIPGETVDQQLARVAAMGATGRLRALWPFLGWTSFAVHVSFWDRTGRRLALTHLSAGDVIAPSHDYQVGARLLSVRDRVRCEEAKDLISSFERSFVSPIEARYPELAGGVDRRILLTAFVEALGAERAVPLLAGAPAAEAGLEQAITRFLEELAREGLTPQRVFFASRRYERWIALNPEATAEARGAMLRELWDTYLLDEVEQAWTDTRVRFFRHTVFAKARPQLAQALDRLMAEARVHRLSATELGELVATLRTLVRPTVEEDYFLARMAYRHLQPGDDAALISLPLAGRTVTDVVVGLTDAEGRRFSVRSPVSAREVARLLQLFHEASLPVTFSSEHEHLLAVDEKGVLLGGVFFRLEGPDRAHLEKFVVARQHRKKGISDGLMQELVRRLRERGVRTLETGFFHPDYLRRFGFGVEPHSGGLFQDLRRPSVRLERP
ncbi:MAG: GNAT family N-acetyltransferase [Deltaproteobacteria bacterium]|nr:GNAT family N-acetyltransferase [Deltaproteobacteria bacterium]